VFNVKLVIVGLVLALVSGVCGVHLLGDARVKRSLAETQDEVASLKAENELLHQQLMEATEAGKQWQQQASAAEQQRQVIAKNLSISLTKLRNQKPPSTCDAAVQWAVEHKEDLAW